MRIAVWLIASLALACKAEKRADFYRPFFGHQDFLAIVRWSTTCDQPLDLKLRCVDRVPHTVCPPNREPAYKYLWFRSTTLDSWACASLDQDTQDVRGLNDPWDCEPESYQIACRSLPGWEIDVSQRGVISEVCLNAPRGQLSEYAKQVLPTLVGWIHSALLIGFMTTDEPVRWLHPLEARFYRGILLSPHERGCFADRCQSWPFLHCGDKDIR